MSTATAVAPANGGNGVKSQGPLVPIRSGERGLELHSLDEMFRFAQHVVASGLAPKGMQNPSSIIVALQMGAELGMPPMASLQNVAVINGRPSVWGDAMLGVCRGSGLFDEEEFHEGFDGSGDNLTATCTVRRNPKGRPICRKFSVGNAKRAGLWGKEGPWKTYPERMLQMRARSWALRDAFADVLRGFYCAEEVADMPPEASGSIVVHPRSLDAVAAQIEGPVAGEVPYDEEVDGPSIHDDEQPGDEALPSVLDNFRSDYVEQFAKLGPQGAKRLYDDKCGPTSPLNDEERAIVAEVYEADRARRTAQA